MSAKRDIEQVNELLDHTTENAWFDFKKNNTGPKKISQLCSAIANTAYLADKPFGYVVWGIEDRSHKVVGTRFDPDAKTGEHSI